MPAWLLLVIQNAPEIASLAKQAIDYFESLSEQDKQKIRDQLEAAGKMAVANNATFDAETKQALDDAQAQIDKLKAHPNPAVAALGAVFDARLKTFASLPAPKPVQP